MGRLAIMMVMGLALALSVVGYQINQTNSRSVEHVVSFQRYTMARNIAHSGINMVLRKFDSQADTGFINKVNRGVKVGIPYGFMYGSCMESVWVPDPAAHRESVVVKSYSTYLDTTYYMDLRLRRSPQPFPWVNAAVGLRAPNVDWSISGNAATIDGRDHDINGNWLNHPADDKPGVAVWTGTDTTKVLGRPPGSFYGSPRKTVKDTTLPNPSAYADQLINAASYNYTGPCNVTGNNTWGSSSNPIVIYANATAGSIKFAGTCEGWGILICKGSLEMGGNFTWHGLVIAYNDVSIEQSALSAGTPNVIGAFLMSGASGSSFSMKGNCSVQYSKAALNNAMLVGNLQSYKVIKWYE